MPKPSKRKHKHPLSKRDRSAIRRLSRANVGATLRGLKKFASKRIWIGKTNRYLRDTIDRIAADAKARVIRKPKQLAQYVAASALLHCVDGWSYLGRALTAMLRGDPHRCRHLAYYAELRAAMSLMAAEGVGIFDRRHCAITAPNVATLLETNSATHTFAWECLKYWGLRMGSAELFANIVKPQGRSLDEWLVPLGGASVLAPHARSSFLQWGMDLKMFPADKDARNVSSYRPDGMNGNWMTNGNVSLQFVRDLWASFEPMPGSPFENIDRHILRVCIENIFKGQMNKEPAQAAEEFKKFVRPVVAHQGLDQKLDWLQFLTRSSRVDDLSVLTFSRESPNGQANSHLAMTSRAALLLRFATGATGALLKNAGLQSDSIAFWQDEVGNGRGLWDGDRGDTPLTDLWADIEVLLEEAEHFQSGTRKEEQTFYRISNELAVSLNGLGSFERVAIWSSLS